MSNISVIVNDSNNITAVVDQGVIGPTGPAATVAVGTTTTLSPGASATVTNSGTSSAAVLNFGIPQGQTGTAATIAAGTTTTLAPGSSATVSNSGTSSAAVFNFGIPQGTTGLQGIPGINWLGTWSGATTYAIRDAVAYLGSSYYAIASNTNQAPPNASFWNLLAEKGIDGTGAGTVTSVNVSGGTTGLTTSGGPVTVAGTITLAGTLAIANGGTGQTTRQAALDALAGAVTAGQYLRGDGTDVVMSAIQAADVPTLNQNTTGTAANVTGVVAVANGGTGLTAFTANGVVYASSTSAITTGGVLTFDGSNFGVLAGSVTSPAAKIHAVGNVRSSNGAGTIYSSLASDGVYATGTDLYLFAQTGFANIFYANNAEGMRLTGTGLGIGTASPAAKFDLVGDYKEGVVTANTSTAYTISTATGTVQILTLTGNCTFTFPTATTGESFTLLLRQDGTGGRTVTWPANVRWPGGTAPTITSTASRQDKYVFTADGTNWYGSNAGQNYTV